jgi:glutamine phosphoribosylpyrophosphate amidotransferase
LATTGGYRQAEWNQPIEIDGRVLVAHNGTVPEWERWRESSDYRWQTSCDSEVLGWWLAQRQMPLSPQASREMAEEVLGGRPYVVVVLTEAGIWLTRRGHPLYVDKREETWYACSRAFPGACVMGEGERRWWPHEG